MAAKKARSGVLLTKAQRAELLRIEADQRAETTAPPPETADAEELVRQAIRAFRWDERALAAALQVRRADSKLYMTSPERMPPEMRRRLLAWLEHLVGYKPNELHARIAAALRAALGG